MVERPEVVCHWDPMLIAGPLQQHRDRPSLFVNIRKRHTENAMTACERTPVADPLSCTVQQREDRFIPPGGGRVNQLLGEWWINLPWDTPWDPSAQFGRLPAPGCVATRHPMGIRVV